MSQVGFGALLPLLLVLTSGWLVLRSRYGKTFIWWQSGYNLYFRIAFTGILCLVLGLIISAAILTGFNLVESSCGNGEANLLSSLRCLFQYPQEIFTLAAWLTLPIGAVGYAVGNLWPKANSQRLKKKHESIVQRKNFEGYIKKTMEEHSFLLITLKSRKVYVGAVTDINQLQFNELDAGEEKYLRVILIFSGYRGDTDLQMDLTADYTDEKLQERIREASGSSADLEIMLPVKEITSIQPFDPQVYREFFMDREGVD